jgi:hypothetical protein
LFLYLLCLNAFEVLFLSSQEGESVKKSPTKSGLKMSGTNVPDDFILEKGK